MIEPNFAAIGKIPGESIFVHKDDLSLLSKEENTRKIKCIVIGPNHTRGKIISL